MFSRYTDYDFEGFGLSNSAIKTWIKIVSFFDSICYTLIRYQFVLIAIAFLTNLFHIFILLQKSMRSNSVNVLMIGIAASDLFVMGYLVFQHPLELLASINECVILILVTLVLSILWSLFNYMKYSLTDSDNPWQPAPSCTGFPVNHTELQFYIQQKQEVEIESDIKTEFFLIADGVLKIIPTMMFPILTGLLLIELKAAISRRKQLTATQSQEKSTRVDHTTKLVVWMTAMFMAAEGPLGIFYVLEGLVQHSVGFS
ncbi:hypothetical protein B9Z55_017312 [Caenorhabditis nigoni]|uniref:G-protein coupled receptors family 1 profile domain-containing protein n=1 Tax=Caenorhabditis nigoni TaxID=1611254 RepID=A0A2G5T9C2_9PELO|nr:hypothetical protein B9Z55_017312 [Caenorhabditis nigoni]